MSIIPPPKPWEARYAYNTFRSPESIKNYNILSDFLKKISYKPGWKFWVQEDPNNYAFLVEIQYEGYESENQAFEPLCYEEPLAAQSREILLRSIGKNVRKKELRFFRRRFDFFILDQMAPENVIRYIIADTIKQAEMFEFDRWFKFEGIPIFERKEEK